MGEAVFDNDSICYQCVQRIYRNAVVNFFRIKLSDIFPGDHEQRIKALFKPEEWVGIEEASSLSRRSQELSAEVKDALDLLGVNHFFNIFDKYFNEIVDADVDNKNANKKRKKQNLLGWVRSIKNLRDPLSHPAEEEFSYEDAYVLLDCARRVLLVLGLDDDAQTIRKHRDGLNGAPLADSDGLRNLETRLPPRESIVVEFIGRGGETEVLWNWFDDPSTKRWALSGDGGKGKSAIAYNFALDVANKAPTPYQAVFWLSAKKKMFVDGTVVNIGNPDFYDLDSVTSAILSSYGWTDETANPIETKRNRCLQLLNEFPCLLIIDDVDSIDSENEDAIEFLSFEVPGTKSKVLFTSRRVIFGMGGTTTRVEGMTKDDAEKFILSRCKLMELDLKSFGKDIVAKIASVTDRSPLYMEDLLRLTSVMPISDAISLWKEKGGKEARKYALGRECDQLYPSAKKVLFTACICPGPISFPEIEAIVGISSEELSSSLGELQKIFLFPKPKIIEGEQRFEVNANTRTLVREVYGASDIYIRLASVHRSLSVGMHASGRGDIAAIITQVVFLVRGNKHSEAETLVLNALQKYIENVDLLGILGWVYRTWKPIRLTDAREKYARAAQLKSKREDMYFHWARMECDQSEWTKAYIAADKGLALIPDSKRLKYLSGYSRSRIGKELVQSMAAEKAHKYFSEAKRLLESIITEKSDFENDTHIKCDTFRALVLQAEGQRDKAETHRYLNMWKANCPDDPLFLSVSERINKKRSW